MPPSPLPERCFAAHTVSLIEDEFARTIGFDGRRSDEELDALMIQFAIDPQDGEDPYLEIPIQRFVADGGLLKFSVHRDRVVVQVDGEAGERLGGIYRWEIAIPPGQRAGLIAFSRQAFVRHPDLLEIKET